MNPKVEDETTSLRTSPLQDNGRWGLTAVQLPLLLWLLTLLIWLPWLGNLPLRDWDEALVAGVSRSTAAQPAWDWLLAVKNSEAIYLNKPPGLHWLIGASIKRFGDLRMGRTPDAQSAGQLGRAIHRDPQAPTQQWSRN